ncbi:hypothetical protein IWX92DRAFT_358606 [Phyllosticta citricarpa]
MPLLVCSAMVVWARPVPMVTVAPGLSVLPLMRRSAWELRAMVAPPAVVAKRDEVGRGRIVVVPPTTSWVLPFSAV